MLTDLAFALARRGWRVSVITSRQRYDDPTSALPAYEISSGVDVHRIWTTRFGRQNLFGRAIDYLTFYASAAWRLWRTARAGDIVITKTDPPILSILTSPIAYIRGAIHVNWLQDLFPEVVEALTADPRSRLNGGYRLLRVIRNWSLRRSRMNVAIGSRMADHLISSGVHHERVTIIGNWADGELVKPQMRMENSLRHDWGLRNKFVIGYSGNLGRAHTFDTMIDTISRLEVNDVKAEQWLALSFSAGSEMIAPIHTGAGNDILWLFIGGGALRTKLEAEIRSRQLRSVQFRPYQPRERLSESLSVPDVHLVVLRPELEGLIVPSKYYGIAAAGRPTIFVGDPQGEIAQILSANQSGWTISPGDGAGLANLIKTLATDPKLVQETGRRARIAFENNFDFPFAVDAWEEVFKQVQKGHPKLFAKRIECRHAVKQHPSVRKTS